jgi:hypothetical protein
MYPVNSMSADIVRKGVLMSDMMPEAARVHIPFTVCSDVMSDLEEEVACTALFVFTGPLQDKFSRCNAALRGQGSETLQGWAIGDLFIVVRRGEDVPAVSLFARYAVHEYDERKLSMTVEKLATSKRRENILMSEPVRYFLDQFSDLR